MDSVTLRPARADDLPDIVAMRSALNRLELEGCPHASITKMTLEEFAAHWGPTIDDPDYCWRLVEVEGKPVGFGLLYLLKPRVPSIVGFVQWAFIDPACRRKGLGERLVRELFRWAKEKNVERIELQFIDGNLLAERFWKKMGFEPYARKSVKRL